MTKTTAHDTHDTPNHNPNHHHPLTPTTSNKSTTTSPTSPTSPTGTTSSRRSSLSEHVAHWKHKVDDKLARARPYVERLSGTYEPIRREASPEVRGTSTEVKGAVDK
jgi:hypothetical protein